MPACPAGAFRVGYTRIDVAEPTVHLDVVLGAAEITIIINNLAASCIVWPFPPTHTYRTFIYSLWTSNAVTNTIAKIGNALAASSNNMRCMFWQCFFNLIIYLLCFN